MQYITTIELFVLVNLQTSLLEFHKNMQHMHTCAYENLTLQLESPIIV